MEAISVNRAAEVQAARFFENNRRMEWRAKRYPTYFTPREIEAMQWDVFFMQSQADHNERSIQRLIAGKMKCSQSNVSQLLRSADDVMAWLIQRGIDTAWVRVGDLWHLEIYG